MGNGERQELVHSHTRAIFFPGAGAGGKGATHFRMNLQGAIDSDVIVPSSITTTEGIRATPLRRRHSFADELLGETPPSHLFIGGHSIGTVDALDLAGVLVQDKRVAKASRLHMAFFAAPGFGERFSGIPALIKRARRMAQEKEPEVDALTDAGYSGDFTDSQALRQTLLSLLNGGHIDEQTHNRFLTEYHEDVLPQDYVLLRYLVAVSFYLRAGLQWSIGMDTKLIRIFQQAQEKNIRTTASFVFFGKDPIYTQDDRERIENHMRAAGFAQRVFFSVEQDLGHAAVGYSQDVLKELFRREMKQLYS